MTGNGTALLTSVARESLGIRMRLGHDATKHETGRPTSQVGPYPLTRRASMKAPATNDRKSVEKLAAGGPEEEGPPAAAGGTYLHINARGGEALPQQGSGAEWRPRTRSEITW